MPLKLAAVFPPRNVRPMKSILAAAYIDLELDVVFHDYTHTSPDFARNCHPLCRTPVLETSDGYIFESGSILRYIARQDTTHHIYGHTAFEASSCDMWVDYASGELDAHTVQHLRAEIFGFNDAAALNEATEAINSALEGIETWLETRTFLVGERLTIADIAVASSVWWIGIFHQQADAILKKYKNVTRLYNTVMQQPKIVDALKRNNATYVFPTRAKEAKPKEEKKEAKASKPEKPAKEDDDDDEPEVKEEKKPNPLDSLPPSPFVLDAFKREYSNNDTRSVAAPYFFKNFDPAGYTAFWCKYKYNEENKKQFMTANFVRGWFQRMEHTRKYAFGVSLIIGNESKHEIVAFWVFRGKGMPQIVTEVEDTELFTWVEIPDVTAQAEAITDYLCWEGPTIPLPVLEGRTFK